nr:sialidase family protein [uncultured Sphingomonas sp.]
MAKISELPQLLEPTGLETVVVLDAGETKRVPIADLAAAAVAPQVGRAVAAAEGTVAALAAVGLTAVPLPQGSFVLGIETPLGETVLRVTNTGDILFRDGRYLLPLLDQALNASNSITFVMQPDGSPAQRFEDRLGQSLYPNGQRPARTAPLPNGFSLTDQWRYNDQVAADPITPQPIPILTSSNDFWPESMRGTTSHIRIPTVAASPSMALFACEGRVDSPNDAAPNRIIARMLSTSALAAIDTRKDYTAALKALPKQFELLVAPNEASTSHTFVDPMTIYDRVLKRFWIVTAYSVTKTMIGVYTDDNGVIWRGASGAPLALPISADAAVQMPQLGSTGYASPTHGITTREGVTMFPFRRPVAGQAKPNLVLAAFDRAAGRFEIRLEVPGDDPRLLGGVDELTITQAPRSGDILLNSRRGGGAANRLVLRLSPDGSQLLDSWIDETLVDIEASAGMLTFSSSHDGLPDRILFSNNQSNETSTDAGSRYGLGVKVSYEDGAKATFRGKGPIWPLYDVAYRDALGVQGFNAPMRRGTGYSDLMPIDAERFGVFHEGSNMFAGRNEAVWHHSAVLTILNLRSILA